MPNDVKKLIIDGVTYDLAGGGVQPIPNAQYAEPVFVGYVENDIDYYVATPALLSGYPILGAEYSWTNLMELCLDIRAISGFTPNRFFATPIAYMVKVNGTVYSNINPARALKLILDPDYFYNNAQYDISLIYAIPNSEDYYKIDISISNGVVISNTMSRVTIGGGGSVPGYTKLGAYNLANSQYTDESGSSILASVGANNEIVITATNTMIGDIAILHATAVSIAVSNGGTPQFIEAVPSVVLEEIVAGQHTDTYIFDFVFELPTTQRSRAEIQLVVDGSTQTVLNNSFNLIPS